MGKKGGAGPPSKRKKSEVVFNEDKRRDFLTGFRKRKEERRKKAREQFEKSLKEEIKAAKEKAREDMKNADSASHRVVPEIEHLLQDTFPTDVHDLGSHTISVTHLDLDKRRTDTVKPEAENEGTEPVENNEEGAEEDGNKQAVPGKKKHLKKAITKSLNDLQSLKQRSMPKKSKRQMSKFSRKSAKSKRTKHFNPKKKVPE